MNRNTCRKFTSKIKRAVKDKNSECNLPNFSIYYAEQLNFQNFSFGQQNIFF